MLKSRSHFSLKSGELLICREPRLVSTVLGSCVAVTMFTARLPLAAICHAMLPAPRRGCDLDNGAGERFKYLTQALSAMFDAFQRAGILADEIEVKMFGGGNVIGVAGEANLDLGVGEANIRMARRLLGEHQLPIKAANVGGQRGRKIFFDTATGEIFHKFLTSTRLQPR